MEFFEVGGCIRDEILGVRSKDIDFSVIAPSFESMRQAIVDTGMKIVVETPEFFTIRAVAKQPFQGQTGGLDFVWARKDGAYTDGRRPDSVEPGTLHDDLARRDFTMNAIAKAADGSFIDPFGGQRDIANRRIETVGHPLLRFREDSLRVLRAMRFSITKGFDISQRTQGYMQADEVIDALANVSKERQREEMEKMFAHNTLDSLLIMQKFSRIRDVVFSDGLRLSATMKH